MKYLSAVIRKMKGQRVDKKVLERRGLYANININRKELSELEEMHKQSIINWKSFKDESKRKREEQLMELYLYDIAEDTEENAKRRRKALKKVMQA